MRLWDSKGSVNLLRISYVSLTNLHTRRFRLTVSFCRFLSSFYESYRMGRSSPSTSLMPQLVQAVILPQHGASADSKGSGNFLRISSVLPTSLHIRRDVFVEIDPPAGLSSIHSPTLGRVWYHAPWWRCYRRYRRCGQLLFGRLLW